jgi:predicted metal-dependent hydrolase
MTGSGQKHHIADIDFTIIYSGRRTIGISVLPDARVIVRVPYLTSLKSIERIVSKKAAWISKHRDNYIENLTSKTEIQYRSGEIHLFRGKEKILMVKCSSKQFVSFLEDTIEIGTNGPGDQDSVRKLLYKGYKDEASRLFTVKMQDILTKHQNYNFRPAGLIIRTMKRRWGSCSNKGVITLSTELIKLPDLYQEYVITHELCHLKHHNHGKQYYALLTEVFPEWKPTRKEMRKYVSSYT